ncbi:MAG: ABC transporter permease [Propionicimonas sp.]
MTQAESRAAGTAAAKPAARGLWSDALRRLRRDKLAMIGAVVIVVFALAAILAPWIAPFDPNAGELLNARQPPSAEHIMGTDTQGRDMFSRILYGARISLTIGVVAVAMGVIGGAVLGAIAGLFGGWVDSVVMRVVDALLAIPQILLAIGIITWLGPGVPQLLLAISIAYVPVFARLLRGSLLAVRGSDYVIAAQSVGAKRMRVLLRHMFPNALTPLIVQATLELGSAIIAVAGLGFLGLGSSDPRTPEWGAMLTDGRSFLLNAPLLIFFPSLAIVLSVIAFNLVGDGMRRALDPRTRR